MASLWLPGSFDSSPGTSALRIASHLLEPAWRRRVCLTSISSCAGWRCLRRGAITQYPALHWAAPSSPILCASSSGERRRGRDRHDREGAGGHPTAQRRPSRGECQSNWLLSSAHNGNVIRAALGGQPVTGQRWPANMQVVLPHPSREPIRRAVCAPSTSRCASPLLHGDSLDCRMPALAWCRAARGRSRASMGWQHWALALCAPRAVGAASARFVHS